MVSLYLQPTLRVIARPTGDLPSDHNFPMPLIPPERGWGIVTEKGPVPTARSMDEIPQIRGLFFGVVK